MQPSDAELAQLYDRYAPVLYRRCRSILGNEEEAADAVQETFAKVIVHAVEFRGQSSPLTWMYRISTNLCLNRIRDRKGRLRKLEDRGFELVPTDGESESAGDHPRIRRLLAEVDDEMRAVVVHTFFDDCTRAETARLVGVSVPTVRKRVRQFLDHARRSLSVAALALVLLTLWRP
ncbi:MAG: RNA polymerase sigma-70 factor (ECF subfamily) [Myxococcota bacterium]|jgi:RNA polymerase sigma-70 factor (ECF subfamily)